MMGLIYTLGRMKSMGPFSSEPIGARTIMGSTIFETLASLLLKAGVEGVLIVCKEPYSYEVPGATIIKEDELSEYLDEGDLILSVPENLVASEGILKELQELVEEGDEAFLGSLSIKTPRIVKTSLGPTYFLGVSVCSFSSKEKAYGKPCGNLKLVSNVSLVHVMEPKDLLKALDVRLMDIKETRISPRAKVHSDVIIEGPVVIEDGAVIYERTKIVGPAYIGKNALVGNSSLIRRSSLNARSTVGFSTEVKHSVIEEDASTGRLSYIGDSFIGRYTTIVGGIMTINYKPGFPKLGAFISPRNKISGFKVFEYYTVIRAR